MKKSSLDRPRKLSPEGRRYAEYVNAERTIHPELSPQEAHLGKKHFKKPETSENPGNMLELLKKTLD